jgi:hypothetical protein
MMTVSLCCVKVGFGYTPDYLQVSGGDDGMEIVVILFTNLSLQLITFSYPLKFNEMQTRVWIFILAANIGLTVV